MSPNPTSETRQGPTPNGGVSSVIYYLNANGESTTKAEAVRAEIVELDAQGETVHRTYMESESLNSTDKPPSGG